jgi:hypothetical protein
MISRIEAAVSLKVFIALPKNRIESNNIGNKYLHTGGSRKNDRSVILYTVRQGLVKRYLGVKS